MTRSLSSLGVSALIAASWAGPRSHASTLPGVAAGQGAAAIAEAGRADLDTAQALLAEARSARDAKDLTTARAKAVRAIEVLLTPSPNGEDEARAALLVDLGSLAQELGEVRAAEQARRRVVEVRTRTLSDEHLDLQAARHNLAVTLYTLGDLHAARSLMEKVLDVYARTLPDDDPRRLRASSNLASALKDLGDLPAARALEERVLEMRLRTQPEDHADLQSARGNLANTLYALGDLPGALALQEQVLEIRTRTLPEEHTLLQAARLNLATTLAALGDLSAALALQEQVLEVFSRTLPDEHPHQQVARQALAATLHSLGDLSGARALQEKAFEVRSRTLPGDHPELQLARGNLAFMLRQLGDLPSARALEEQVLEVFSRTLPDDHPDLQAARVSLAITLRRLGDLRAAQVLQEKALEVRSRTLPEDHPGLLSAQLELAGTLWRLGDFTRARALQEQVLELRTRVLPEDHLDIQVSRQNLANTLSTLGDFPAARALCEQVLEVDARTLPDDHPNLRVAWSNLAFTIAAQHAAEAANAAEASDAEGEQRLEFARIARGFAHAVQSAARNAARAPSGREAEERCAALLEDLSKLMSLAAGADVFAPDSELDRASFLASEHTRGAAFLSAILTASARADSRYEPLRLELQRTSEELARLAQAGTTTPAYATARSRREAAERDLVQLSSELGSGADRLATCDVDSLSSALGEREALVGYRRYTRSVLAQNDPAKFETIESLCAFVLRGGGHLARIELGPIAPIEAAVERWRVALGVATAAGDGVEREASVSGLARVDAGADRGVGAERAAAAMDAQAAGALRRIVFDPLIPELRGIDHVVLAPDDVMYLVPLDALPTEGSAPRGVTSREELVGERWSIELRTTLLEILLDRGTPRIGGLLALGDPAYDEQPGDAAAPTLASAPDTERPLARDHTASAQRTPRESGVLRGGAWEGGFEILPATRGEVRAIGDHFAAAFGEQAPRLVLERGAASRGSLFARASSARFLHLATHGWFAPDSISTWSDPEPIDAKLNFGRRESGEQQMRGMNPMLLCGVALAGANSSAGATGRVPGLVTAEEISTLDLSQCDLAVLSACETSVGLRRAGQGVASLQKALHMAGARSVITSLWKVPDVATQELMVDFYRRMWVGKKPKSAALWEAKMKLRDAQDEHGTPKYATRDWAAWVLTGEPR